MEKNKVNWSVVYSDAPVKVRLDSGKWVKRHFAKYEDGLIYVWDIGHTAWTSNNNYAYSEPYDPNSVVIEEDNDI